MIESVITVLTGIMFGLVAGLLPGVGSSAVMIAAFPMLMDLPPNLCILFYAAAVQSAQFSGSVSALNFGLMGELTSQPAIMERNTVIEHQQQLLALKITAVGSVIGCLTALLLLFPLLKIFSSSAFLLRTDTLFVLHVVILAIAVFARYNSALQNILLIMVGVILSQIGLQFYGSIEKEFLTLGLPVLYSGVPMIAVLGGFIAVPCLMSKIPKIPDTALPDTAQSHGYRVNLGCLLRSSALGALFGMIPIIGTQISSYVGWFVEKKLRHGNSIQDSLQRLCAAETANNSSQVTVLIPLLILGVAIVPSEMILLNVLDLKNWSPFSNDLESQHFYITLALALMLTALLCYLICYASIKRINHWIARNLQTLNYSALIVLMISVTYLGTEVESAVFFLACFLIFGATALIFKKINFIPLVIGYFLGDTLINSWLIVHQLYDFFPGD